VALPGRWEAIDIDEEGIEALIEIIESLDSEWAKNTAAVLSSETMAESLKFWARDTEMAGAGFASVNVLQQRMVYRVDAETSVEQLEAAYESMGIEVLAVDKGLEINGVDTARIEIRVEAGFAFVRQSQYVFIRGRNLTMMGCAVDDTAWSDYESIFEDIAGTFALYGSDE
jgi:hypothetical protein